MQTVKAEATLIPDDPSCGGGSELVSFHRRNGSDFPIVECESDIMKSFGIPYGSFDPDWDIFIFEREGMKLRLVAEKHGFVLSDIRLV